MRSTFSGLNLAATALSAQRRAIETVGHNVANVNTPGYSRQRVDLENVHGGLISLNGGTFAVGAGVDVKSQARVVDQFLVNRTNTERAMLGLQTERQSLHSRIELTYGEPSDSGLASQLEQFWSAWDTVAIAPEDGAARAALLQQGEAVTDRFRYLSTQFSLVADDAVQRAEAATVEINGIAEQVAELNDAISAAHAAGAPPNDLLDQRDQLVRQLSDQVGVTTRVLDNGYMQVSIGGAALVDGITHHRVTLDTANPTAVTVRISNSTVPLRPTGGRLQGLLEAVNVTLPGQQAQLDAVASQLRDVVNAQHALGQDLTGAAGGDFFAGTGAADLRLAPGVAGNPDGVAAAMAGEGAFSGNNAVALAELADLVGGPDDSYRALITAVGVDAQTANRRFSLQSELTEQIDSQREAVSGVSVDEEMTNLIAFQQAYDASARFLTALDQLIDTLINGTGTVGR